jgi:hypothetical protein
VCVCMYIYMYTYIYMAYDAFAKQKNIINLR